jgi:molybdenum cofactor cytidylyltransferase
MREVVAIVPAAGASERFGEPKQVADVEGATMLDRVVETLYAAGLDEVVVVIGGQHEKLVRDRAQTLERCRVVVNPTPERGMFSSLQEGFNAAASARTYLVAVGDMPFVRQETVRAIVAAHGGTGIVSPRYHGKRGHPIAVDEQTRQSILEAEPVPGFTLHDVLSAQADRRDLDVDDPGVVRDVDTRAHLSASYEPQ